MKYTEKKKALVLRKRGESLKSIASQLGVSKSSVSTWVRDVPLSMEQLKFLGQKGFTSEAIEKRRMTRNANEKTKRDKVMLEGARNIRALSKNDLRIVGLCLYWGEGGKTIRGMARISNSDPAVIKVMMRFFREVCLVEEKKFRGSIHIHSHLESHKAEKYWSTISGIPQSQFYKTYAIPSIASKGKRDTLPYGTFDIYVCSTKLFLEIIGQIEKIKEVLNCKA